jgi:hypothetical protein
VLVQKCWKVVRIGAVLLSMTNILLGWASQVSIASLAPLEPRDPFSALFTITNDGKLPIYNLQLGCYIARVDYEPLARLRLEQTLVRLQGFHENRLGTGEPKTIQRRMPLLAAAAVREAEVVIPACFRPFFFPLAPWRTIVERRFQTVANSNRHFQWVGQPMIKASLLPACYDLDNS